jgi:hypothetical protein
MPFRAFPRARSPRAVVSRLEGLNHSPRDNNDREDAFYSSCACASSARKPFGWVSKPPLPATVLHGLRGMARGSANRTKDAYAQCSLVNDRHGADHEGALVRASITPRIMREVICDGAFCVNIDCKT